MIGDNKNFGLVRVGDGSPPTRRLSWHQKPARAIATGFVGFNQEQEEWRDVKKATSPLIALGLVAFYAAEFYALVPEPNRKPL
ncbi:hypothetical protein GCN74_17565 [Janthinobacterium sp. FT14W]|uniref:hypothetical protein n=1 Tax=Janthinobacterium sp. FT14W TaxID=2654253 RepID=UPI00126509E6|nr:hypothetical protein [Janthinobacterium sp. FT14W]KAB8058032.1 hypothetical protein GCN74_17565 [Janthinobacterium sp. FT14W]